MSERALTILLIVLLVLLGGLQYRLWTYSGSVEDQKQLLTEIAEQQEENQRLHARNTRLAREISEMKQSLDGVEEYARRELGMIKAGETLYQIVE
ncbi:MAG: septum formation initiator family protein [Pseudomonadota bacterium]